MNDGGGGRCDCKIGRLRRAKKRAVKWMKRHPFGAVEGSTGRDVLADILGRGRRSVEGRNVHEVRGLYDAKR